MGLGFLGATSRLKSVLDGQRSRVDPHGTQFVDENGVTLRGWIDSEDLTLWEADARVQLAVGNAKTWIAMECHGDCLCVIVVHAVGNLHLFKGPDDFNGYGYFHVRFYCTGFEFQANIVEEYVLLSALLHIFAGLKRTRDQKLSSGIDEWSMEFGYD